MLSIKEQSVEYQPRKKQQDAKEWCRMLMRFEGSGGIDQTLKKLKLHNYIEELRAKEY